MVCWSQASGSRAVGKYLETSLCGVNIVPEVWTNVARFETLLCFGWVDVFCGLVDVYGIVIWVVFFGCLLERCRLSKSASRDV